MSKEKWNLIVTAHPDDETIFMGGTVITHRERPWKLICVTDGNADGQGRKRTEQLREAARLLSINHLEQWDFPDLFEKRLPVDKLVERLKAQVDVEEVYTHGPLGEYGHPHHQDVSYATHRAFVGQAKVFSVAYNSHPTKRIPLSKEAFSLKQKILSSIYFSETERFVHLLPCSFVEGFHEVSWQEVENIYGHLTGKKEFTPNQLSVFRAMEPYLKSEESVFSCRL